MARTTAEPESTVNVCIIYVQYMYTCMQSYMYLLISRCAVCTCINVNVHTYTVQHQHDSVTASVLIKRIMGDIE